MADIDIGLLFEALTTTEDRTLTVGQAMTVEDLLAVTDFAQVAPGIIEIISNIIDQAAITEFVELIPDLVLVEFEQTVVFEFAEGTVGNAFIKLEAMIVTENVQIGLDPILLLAGDNVAAIENLVIGKNILDVDVNTIVTVTELPFGEPSDDLAFNDFLRSYPFTEDTIHNIIVNVFENGSEQRRDKWGRSRKRFTVVFAPRQKTEIDPLKSFFGSAKASANEFFFENPLDSITYRVRFEQNSLRVERVAFDIYQSQATLIEVF